MAEQGFLIEVRVNLKKPRSTGVALKKKKQPLMPCVLILEYKRPIVVKNLGSRMVANRSS